MPAFVVDGLEVVQVDQHQNAGRRFLVGIRQAFDQGRIERPTIEQARQAVVGRFPGQSLFFATAGAVVPDHEYHTVIMAFPAKMKHCQVYIEELARPVSQGGIQAIHIGTAQKIVRFPATTFVFNRYQREKILLLAVFGQSKEPARGLVGVSDNAFGIHHQYAFLQYAQDAVCAFLFLGQLRFNLQLMGDIPDHGNGTQGTLLRLNHRRHGIRPHHSSAGAAFQAESPSEHCFAAQSLPPRFNRARPVLFVNTLNQGGMLEIIGADSDDPLKRRVHKLNPPQNISLDNADRRTLGERAEKGLTLGQGGQHFVTLFHHGVEGFRNLSNFRASQNVHRLGPYPQMALTDLDPQISHGRHQPTKHHQRQGRHDQNHDQQSLCKTVRQPAERRIGLFHRPHRGHKPGHL